tara:strand:+ start:9969 stop:10634 length:666 start_codon:yes stop_codon:yes gene_type:complete
MLMFSNGCSFLAMRPKDNVMTFTSKILAEDYGMDLVNLAMGGRGNIRISFTTKHWIEKFYKKDIFALIGWSSYFRNDYVTDDGWKKGRIAGTDTTWRTWKTLDNTNFVRNNQGWDIENDAIVKFLDHVYNLQNYFRSKNIPYLMYNALPNNIESTLKDVSDFKTSIDWNRFYMPETSHLNFIQEKNYIVSPNDPHPSIEGHQEWAKLLKEYIDANNLRTIK